MYGPDVNQVPLHLLSDTMCTVMFIGHVSNDDDV